MDLLGLKNLTLIDKALKLIACNHGKKIDIDRISLDDSQTFALICQGKTSGVFQLESNGIKEVLCKLQPDKFEDIIAVNALYRPGPLGSGMVDDYIERRHGRQKISYLFPELEPILHETYGVIVYQEQVMKIASAIGGYSLGEADILRRAMGKKKADVMAQQREIFLRKAEAQRFNGAKAGELFDLMAYFAGYGFNKSHSAAYALIAYQTAYLKAHYPAEFMACLISLEANNTDAMTVYLQEAKDMGLRIVPPDINRSQIGFSVIEGALLFGLHGIKNVGLAVLEHIMAERQKKPFADLFDFCVRIDLRTANKRVLESLICAGAFDALPGNRAQKFEELSTVIDAATEKKTEQETGQMGLFDTQPINSALPQERFTFSPRPEWDSKHILEKEREVIGFYLSSHPLETYAHYLRWLAIPSFATTQQKALETQTIADPIALGCGLIRSSRLIMTKKGERMAFVQLEDTVSKAEIVIFPKLFAKVESWLEQFTVFIVKGNVDITSQQQCKIKANEFIPVDLFFQQWPTIDHAIFTLPNNFEESLLHSLKERLVAGTIPLHFIFQENDTKVRLKTKHRIALDHEVIHEIEKKDIKVQLRI